MAFDPTTVQPSAAVMAPDDDRPLIRHHFWSYPYSTTTDGNPDYSATHPLWAVDGFSPIARVLVDNLQGPPGTSTEYEPSAAGAAECVADHVAYSKACTEAAGRAFTSYSFFLQNWGSPNASDPRLNADNTYALATNWDDRVTGGTVTNEAAVHNPYCANGIAQLQAWTIDFLNAFGNQLESRGLPAPTDVHWDWEKRYLVSSFIPVPDGSWPRIIADARYSTELIDGESTLADLYAAGRTSTGGPLTVNTSLSAFNTTNTEWAAWQQMLAWRVNEWALQEALYGPCAAKFPGIRCGNYQFLSRTQAQTWWRKDKTYCPSTQSRDWPLRYSDYSSPEMYPVYPSSIDASGSSTFDAWLAAYGLTRTGDDAADLRALWLAQSKNTLRALATYGAERIAPWLPYPGQTKTYASVNDTTITLDIADIKDLATFAVADIGVRDLLWWKNQANISSLDAYTGVLLYLNSQASRAYGGPGRPRSRRRRS